MTCDVAKAVSIAVSESHTVSALLLRPPQAVACYVLALLAFPLHPAGKPGIERAYHLHDVRVPLLFLQGMRDEALRTLVAWVGTLTTEGR